ncbi:hypothetical protein [Mangrovitalea sediminis]|uniref:hypothetical protein n=1 Tax=Mangrovitalea sediminis TaxID=1982043 RepID=UPI000BE61742|nr:hypothetical protein [Mangrovitalea sediminis]
MIAEFKDFDLEKRPFQSPLDKVLQQDLSDRIGRTANEGCLVPVLAPTGIGKTHSAKSLILEELVSQLALGGGEPDVARTIYYITNSVDNVRHTYEELLELIETQCVDGCRRFSAGQQAVLNAQVVYLPSQGSQLLKLSDAAVERVIDLFELNTDPQIRRAWQGVKKLRQAIESHPNMTGGFREALDEKASETYRLMLSRIQARQRGDHPVALSESDYRDLDHLIPGDKLRRKAARVCFMTTRKFLAGYQTLKNRVHPIRELNGALIIIDELDRQNEVILQVLADQQAMDLIQLMRTLHANLQQHRLERSALYEGIEENFDSLKDGLAEFAESWNIQFAFNTDGASLEDEKVRLFSDRSVTHVHSAEHLLKLRTDSKRQKNLIHSEPKESGTEINKQRNRLSRFVNEADWLFRRFIWIMRESVWSYQNNSAKISNGSNSGRGATYQDAVMSILRHFNLHELSNAVFAAFDAQVSFSGRRDKTSGSSSRMASRTYHDNGLKLTDVRRNESALDTVSCHYTGLSVTPSGLLARMVEGGAKIVGVSATATSRTVIKNFDFDYLKTRLGSRFVELSEFQVAEIGRYYRSRRQYDERGVKVETQFLTAGRELPIAVMESQQGRAVRKPATVLNHWLQQESGNDFVLTWVSKLLQALQHFMDAADSRYMLVLLNRTIDSTRHREFVVFLETFLSAKGKNAGSAVKLFSGMDAQSMRLGDFESVQAHLSSTNDKVIVLSTYASMGEGKNPDYLVKHPEDRQALIWVGDGPEPVEVRTDIDTLYLEKPTHQLLSDAEDYQVNQLLLFHQIMALQEAGWISPREARGWVKQALIGIRSDRHLGQYYRTGDYAWLIRKVIEQAVGRTARTAFKRSRIQLLADGDLREVLASDPRTGESLSHEYLALVDGSKAVINAPIEDRETLRRYNRAALYTADTLALIKELMSGFRGADPQSSIQSWETLRRQLLTEPTRATPSGENPRLYLEAPTVGGYLFSGNLDADLEALESDDQLKFFDQAINGRWVSEADCDLPQLMRNSCVRNHFETNGFATTWQSHFYLMNPAAYFNLYKGALGEEGIRAVLESFGFELSPLPQSVFECFDFVGHTREYPQKIAIDAKHWRADGTVEHHQQKAEALEQSLGIRYVAYINLFGSSDSICRFLNHQLTPVSRQMSTVIEIPGLVDRGSGEVIEGHVMSMLEWMGERQ